jgi:hypothetical protein
MVADKFEGVAALDQADALGDQSLELDRLDLGAVLLGLAAALRLLVAVELALEPRAGQHRAQRLDRIVDLALHGIGFGQRARIGLVLAWAMAIERELVEQIRGW